MHRDENVQSGGGATIEELIAALRVDPLPELPQPAALLIVDDIFKEGKTVAALLNVLRAAGLETRAVVVAVPLRLV